MTVDATPGGAIITVRVIARGGHSRIEGERGGALLVRVSAPPVDGAANEELLRVLGRALGIPGRSLSIVSGRSARQKRVAIAGMGVAEVVSQLSDPR